MVILIFNIYFSTNEAKVKGDVAAEMNQEYYGFNREFGLVPVTFGHVCRVVMAEHLKDSLVNVALVSVNSTHCYLQQSAQIPEPILYCTSWRPCPSFFCHKLSPVKGKV